MDTPLHPTILSIRKLAQQRHAQSIERAQKASQREFARQARDDRAIEDFQKWRPPGQFWRM
jgi:hypothetical protein